MSAAMVATESTVEYSSVNPTEVTLSTEVVTERTALYHNNNVENPLQQHDLLDNNFSTLKDGVHSKERIDKERNEIIPASTSQLSEVDLRRNQTTFSSSRHPDTSKEYLPSDIRKVLLEIAQTGRSTVLPWDKVNFIPLRESKMSQSRDPAVLNMNNQSNVRSRKKRGRDYIGNLTIDEISKEHLASAKKTSDICSNIDVQNKDENGERTKEVKSNSSNGENDTGLENPLVSENGSMNNGELNQQNELSSMCDETSGDKTKKYADNLKHSPPHTSLKEVFRISIELVLDRFYRRKGYKLSPAEKRTTVTKVSIRPNYSTEEISSTSSTENAQFFEIRRHRLLKTLDPIDETQYHSKVTKITSPLHFVSSPPFTIQRLAEVLVSPDRYYTQTHKLCNSLEKLLLVTSSTSDFGGSTGGFTSQNRTEEEELVALADEKGRLQSAMKLKRKRRDSTFSDESNGDVDDVVESSNNSDGSTHSHNRAATENNGSLDDSFESSNESETREGGESREFLDATARATLRTKFDHVSLDPSAVITNIDIRALVENRGMTNSPPLPSGPSNIAMPVLRHLTGGPSSPTSPVEREHSNTLSRFAVSHMFHNNSSSSENTITSLYANTANIQLVQMQQANSSNNGSPFDLGLLNNDHAGGLHGNSNGVTLFAATKDIDLECRSSASSDIDSESDVSFDDSASDRSDGSDTCSGQHNEPMSSARALALSRMQQQQRIQSRAINALHQPTSVDSEKNAPDAGEGTKMDNLYSFDIPPEGKE